MFPTGKKKHKSIKLLSQSDEDDQNVFSGNATNSGRQFSENQSRQIDARFICDNNKRNMSANKNAFITWALERSSRDRSSV